MIHPRADLLTQAGLRARWGVSIRTLGRMRSDGSLPFVRLSERVYLYRLEDVEAIEANRYHAVPTSIGRRRRQA